jgi:ACS family probable galactarate transporter
MSLDATIEQKKVPTRYLILLIIFIVTAVNYADRATLSIAGTEVAKELQLSAVSMGYIFSAFGWAYLLMQIPGGWLLDKFGSKKVYSCGLFFWSLCLPSCKALWICFRWRGHRRSQFFFCAALCWASQKRLF